MEEAITLDKFMKFLINIFENQILLCDLEFFVDVDRLVTDTQFIHYTPKLLVNDYDLASETIQIKYGLAYSALEAVYLSLCRTQILIHYFDEIHEFGGVFVQAAFKLDWICYWKCQSLEIGHLES